MAPLVKLPYYIILSERPYYVCIDPAGNGEYKDLVAKEIKHELKKPNEMKMGKAFMYQTAEMLHVEVFDDETGASRKKFREDVVVAQADEQGRIYIDKDKPELARSILRSLKTLDASIHLDATGWLLPEDDPAKKNLGGRPANPNRMAKHAQQYLHKTLTIDGGTDKGLGNGTRFVLPSIYQRNG